MPLEDKVTRRRVEHEIAKFDLDFALTSVAVINEVAYFTGRVRRLRGPKGLGVEPRREMQKVAEAVRMLPGVRDIVLDCQFD